MVLYYHRSVLDQVGKTRTKTALAKCAALNATSHISLFLILFVSAGY